MQTCPAYAKAPETTRSAAHSRAASSCTITAAFPPSSRSTRFLPATDFRYHPTLALPVKDRVANLSSLTSLSATGISHGSTCTASSGAPALRMHSARRIDVRGACGGGLSTTEQPHASAGESLWATRLSGKLKGASAMTGPAGTRVHEPE